MARFMHAHGVDCGIEGCADGRETLGYFSGDGRRRTASGHGPTLPNPEGGDTWYHGARFSMHGEGDHDTEGYEAFDDEEPSPEEKHEWGGGKVTGPDRTSYEPGEHADKHWNTDLGAHFTSLKAVARGFAGGGGVRGMTAKPSMGRVLHAGLHMSNPAVFADEREMGAHAARWAHKEGYRFHSPFGDAKEPVNEDHYDELRHGNYWHEDEDGETPYEHLGNYSGAHPEHMVDIDKHGVQPRHTQEHLDQYLANHPNREEITTGWKNHLKSQGHDGILYGNTLEGPHGHACAITLDDTTIHHRKWEWLNEHDRDEYDPHGETYKPSTSGAGQWNQDWHSRDGRKPYTGSRRRVAALSPQPGDAVDVDKSYNHKTAIHEHIIDPFEPTERLFAPTKGHLDETLFDEQERMRPEVRKEILKVTDHFFDTHGYTGHERWARVFLAGSQASYWGGNHDFDLLIGINYPVFRQANPGLNHFSDAEVDRHFNEQLRDDFNMDGWRPLFDPHGEPWDRTGYVNHSSWVISDIKPYAAYNVTDDVWAVRPIKEPEGHEFVTTEWYYFEGVAAQILAAMKLQEPARTQTLTHIWDWVHGDRSRAFGPNGTGAFDRSNALEKYLDQYPAPGGAVGYHLMDVLREAKYGKPTQHQKTALLSYGEFSRMVKREAAKPIPTHHDNLLKARLEQSHRVHGGWADKHFHEMTPDEFASRPGTLWHGSPAGKEGLQTGSHSGIHVGTQEAARQALNARIGTPQHGDWDGTREYGKTPLVRGMGTGYAVRDRDDEPRLPSGEARYSDGTKVPMTAKPDLFPVRIVGEMTNQPRSAHDDFKANGLMAGQIKRGTARRGYYYTNAAEDEGSVSAVVPNRAHLATHEDFVRHAVEYGHMGRPIPQHNLDRYGLGMQHQAGAKAAVLGEAMFEHAVGRGLNPADAPVKYPDGKGFAEEIQKRHRRPVVSSRVAMAAADDDWRMQHRPPGRDGIPLHDMTANLPADVYTHPHYYADMSDPSTQDSVSTMRRVRGKPDAKVKVYRALPAEHAHKGIGPGDWVTTSKEYARIHGRQSDPKHDWPVISATVRAGDLHTDGDDFREYGYNGDKSLPGNIAHKGGYHQEVSQKADGTISPVVRRSQSPVKGYDVRHDPQGFDDYIAGRGGVTAYDTQGNYAGHMRWDEDGVFSQNVHEDHQHVADHLIRKMRQQLPKIHRQAALSSDQPITKRANSDGPSTVEDDPARWGVGGWRDRDMSQSKLRETHTGSDGYTYHHAPGSLNGDDEGYGSIYVTHGDDPHNVVGESYYGPHSSLPERLELASRVAPDHRRRGVATGMYDFAERLTGKQTAPADSHSDQAAAFWSHRRASRGHDGIITHDGKYGTSEIVDLTGLHRTAGIFGPEWYERATDDEIDAHPNAESIRSTALPYPEINPAHSSFQYPDGKAWAAKVDPEAIMQKPTPREAALSSDWEISRKRVPTGGSKFGERYELSAMDSDGKRQGWVRYHEPKRKGSPMHVEEVRGDVPGVASHLLNHMESLHPNASRTVFLNDDTKRDKNTPSHTGGDHGKPTDWDQHYDSIGGLHRGFSVRMSPSDARKVNSADRAPEDHVKTLLSQIGGGRAGTHWTSGLRESQNFSQRNQSDPRTDIPVILHAQKPERKDIETRPSELFRHGVFPYDHVEKEVPIRKGRDVVLTGMSWKPDVAHPDADEDGWLHHTFTEPLTKSASLESVASFDPTGEQGWSEIRRQGGANGDLPEGLHFTHGTHEDLPRKYPWIVRPGEHAVRAHVGDKIIGHVKWQSEDAVKGNRKAGWINELGVDSDYHRRGVGSALVDKAKEIDPRVHISTDLTDDGKAWAKGYQGRTASAGDVQYISHQELRNMYSGDYDAPMGKAHGSMLRDWRDYKNGELDEGDIHSGELEHGGPTAHIRHLQDDIAQNGLKDPLVIRGGNVVVDGNHRGVAALNLRLDKIPVRHVAHRKEGSDDMATKSAYATRQRRIAMPWFNNNDGVNPSHAKSVRDAGYAGYVGDSERDEELGHDGHEDEFDEDLWDHVAPHPTHEEKRHLDEHGEYPDSYHERHDEAYGEAQHRKAQEDEMDHDDPDLHHFIGEHGSNATLWKEKGTFGKINIKDQPVYATQSHVNQQHIDHYTASPGDISHSMRNTPGYGKTHAQNPYLADEHPMFVTHEGRLHVIDGHHRVAAALQSGQKHIMGWHYDGDEHGFPDEDEDDWGHHTSSRVQRRPELLSLSAYAKLVLVAEDEETRTREGVTHAGLIVKANDTGRVVVLQRSYKDEEDPARGMLEFPGGGIEPGESAYQAARREWQEETGAHLPEGDPSGSFISNGLYKGFIMVVPSEDDVDIHEAAVHGNPDDPFRLDPEVVMWIDIEHLADGPATRDEVKTGTDWDMLRRAAL